MQVIEELSAIRSYEKMAEAFTNVKWARIAANKDQTVLEEKIEQEEDPGTCKGDCKEYQRAVFL